MTPDDSQQNSADPPLLLGTDGFRAASDRIEQELARAYFALLDRRKRQAGLRFPSTRAKLEITLEVEPGGNGNGGRGGVADGGEVPSGQLHRQLEAEVERVLNAKAPFPMGLVYCHWCRSFECEHASPPDTRSVFAGFRATGQPVWTEFMTLCLEKRDPRVDAIFRVDPYPIALVQSGGELSQAQLPIYGKDSPLFRILAQVVIGYVSCAEDLGLPASAGGRKAPVAMTFQAVQPPAPGRPPVLNILGRTPDGTPLHQALEEAGDRRFADALHSVRRSLDEVALHRRGRLSRRERFERHQRILAILGRLARNLERIFRQRYRRTQHAEERHLNRGRPASSALGDALQASRESVYRDVEENTWVVLGPKNRVHIFNDQAVHVTSVVYPGETVKQRTARGKWRTPKAEDLSAFRTALESRAAIP